jgi:hypothetical protein
VWFSGRMVRNFLGTAFRQRGSKREKEHSFWKETIVRSATLYLRNFGGSRLGLPATLVALAILVLAPVARAQPWSSLGGDPGRSGHQPAESGVASVRPFYALTSPADRDVVTSLTTTGGPPGAERFAYGTADGRVHIRRLTDGQPVGGPVDVSERPDPFGSTSGGGFAAPSLPGEVGQVFVAHNDTGGVSVAQIDGNSGDLVQEVPVAPGYSLRSSALLSPPLNGDGDRALLFVAVRDKPEADAGPQLAIGDNEADIDARKLFKVTVTRPHLREAGIGPVTDTGGIRANPDASPTLIYLTSNNGAKEPYVAVGTATGRVVTHSVAMLAPGPSHSTGGEHDRAMTPAVPVSPSGLPPGAEGSGRTSAPHFFLASTDGETTVLHRVTRPDTSLRFAVADSPKLAGVAGLGIATSQLALPDGSSPGLVYVTTAKNLYALDADTLSLQAQLSLTELPAGTGFSRTAPSVSGNVVFVTRDNGEQLVLDAHTLQPVPAKVFRQDPGNGASKSSSGQPSLAHHRQVLFASDRGVFVYGLG